MTMEEIVQGVLFLLPLVVFSILAFWRLNPVLFLVAAGTAFMTGLNAPDLLSGDTTTALSMSIGLLVIAYALLCVTFAYLTLFRLGRSDGVEDEA